MKRQRVQRLPGMPDLAGESARTMDSVAASLRAYLEENGYDSVSTPIVEDANLFVRKSGGELVSQLYAFTDPGGQAVCLRPEFTSAVIRHHLSLEDAQGVPTRYQYHGPVFRYDPAQFPVRHQRIQLGAEYIGGCGLASDAEVIWLAWHGLKRLGLSNIELWIGSVGLLLSLLNGFELSESARAFVAGSVKELASGRIGVADLVARAEESDLVKSTAARPGERVFNRRAGREQAGSIVQGLAGELVFGPTGRRTSEQIAARLTRKASEANDPAELAAALELVAALVRLSGPPEEVFAGASRVLGINGSVNRPLNDLKGLVDNLLERGVDEGSLRLNLGLARGIAYYTGVVFELGPQNVLGEFGGGGRYDGLVRALGGEHPTPAIGFSYDLDRVVDAVRQEARAAHGA